MFAGIDIGGTSIKGILTDKSGKEYSFRETPTPKTADEIDDAICSLIENLATSASVSKIDILGIGLGSPGTIDKSKGEIIISPNIPSWKNHPLIKNIQKKTGIQCVLENDATSALVGGWWKGNGSKFKHWIMITLGTGIGGGAILDNKIYSGRNGSSLEIGHTTIDLNGIECACGNRGCLEKYASATALIDLTEKYLKKFKNSSINERLKNEKLTSLLVYEEALKKDELAKKVFDEVSFYLGIGMVNIINIFNPEAIILGGGLSQAFNIMLPVIQKTINERALAGLKENVKILQSKDYMKMPSLGAAKIAMESLK